MSNEKNFFQGAINYLKSLPATIKIISIVMLAAVILISNLLVRYNSQFTMFPLYTNEISASDIDSIRLDLTQAGYHEGEQFRVVQKDKGSAIEAQDVLRGEMIIHLANVGLPHNFPEPKEGDFTKTELETQMANIKNLENDLAHSITMMQGIRMANVKIVPEENGVFQNDYKPGKGTVMLMLKPEYSISKAQILGIINLVAGSVKGLSVKNVTLVDDRGVDLSGLVNLEKDPLFIPASATSMSLQMETEKNLTQSVQKLLDWGLGKDNSHVEVRVSLNFDQSEHIMKVLGSPTSGNSHSAPTVSDTGNQGYITIGGRTLCPVGGTDETMNSDGGGHVISWTTRTEDYSKDGTDGNFYKNEEKAFNIDYDKFDTHIVKAPGSIERISVALMLNGEPKERVAELKSLVSAAVGLEPGRGDTIEVANFPFETSACDNMRTEIINSQTTSSVGTKTFPANSHVLYAVCLIPVVLLSVLFLIFMMKQSRSNNGHAAAYMNNSPAGGFLTITDHLSDKNGNTIAPVKKNAQVQLTMIATQCPSEVARLLKTSWMAS